MVFSFVPFGTDENLGLAIAVTLLSMPWYGMAVGMDSQEIEKEVVGHVFSAPSGLAALGAPIVRSRSGRGHAGCGRLR